MRKLILCIDRDDDIGTKTDIDTPIMGREDNLNAAVKLGLKDPEDSDTNSIFSALSTYDELKKEGKDVEIATVCGSQSIGYKSDEVLSKEIDEVLKKVNADSVILVSDGAEDEYITPLITSKIEISHVKTVHVKQAESVENIYYMIVKSLQEEKTKRKILLPISILLLWVGISGVISLLSDVAIKGVEALSGLSSFGVGIIAFVIGAYLFNMIYNIDEKLLKIYKDIRTAISNASVWLPFTIVAVLIVLGSGLRGWNAIMDLEEATIPMILLTFAYQVIWWWIGAILLHELGQLIHTYITQGKIKRSFWAILFSLLALTFIFYGALEYIRLVLGMQEGQNALPMVAINITLGLLIIILGGLTRSSLEENEAEEDESIAEEPTPER